MEFSFSHRIAGLQGSLIREILKSSSLPGVISFAGGNPSPEAFPAHQAQQILSQVLQEAPETVLQYSVTEGYPPLREALCRRLKEQEGCGRDFDQLLVVSGSQQSADLLAKALVDPGDTVLCEDPSFVGCLNTFRSYEANLVGIPLEEDGISLPRLEEALSRQPRVKLLYLIPNFQNPTGITTSLEKRRAVYALCRRHGVVIMEDDPYGQLRYSGTPVPPIKSLDEEGIVVYCGSFSKVLAPGIRVGYMLGPQALIERCAVGKQCADVHTNMPGQYLAERFMTQYDFAGHLERIRRLYAHKCALMLRELDAQLDPRVAHTRPEGGLFIMATLPGGMDSLPFCQALSQEKVAAVPGVAFLADQSQISPSFRLNFSTVSDEKIAEGVAILGRLTRRWLEARS